MIVALSVCGFKAAAAWGERARSRSRSRLIWWAVRWQPVEGPCTAATPNTKAWSVITPAPHTPLLFFSSSFLFFLTPFFCPTLGARPLLRILFSCHSSPLLGWQGGADKGTGDCGNIYRCVLQKQRKAWTDAVPALPKTQARTEQKLYPLALHSNWNGDSRPSRFVPVELFQ